MVFLDSLAPTLPSPVVVFVDSLIGLHLLALGFYLLKLSAEFVLEKKRTRRVQRED